MDALPGAVGWHSRGYLPHFDGGSIPQMVNFRLADSLPQKLLDQWRSELSALPEEKATAEQAVRREKRIVKLKQLEPRGSVGALWT